MTNKIKMGYLCSKSLGEKGNIKNKQNPHLEKIKTRKRRRNQDIINISIKQDERQEKSCQF